MIKTLWLCVQLLCSSPSSFGKKRNTKWLFWIECLSSYTKAKYEEFSLFCYRFIDCDCMYLSRQLIKWKLYYSKYLYSLQLHICMYISDMMCTKNVYFQWNSLENSLPTIYLLKKKNVFDIRLKFANWNIEVSKGLSINLDSIPWSTKSDPGVHTKFHHSNKHSGLKLQGKRLSRTMLVW